MTAIRCKWCGAEEGLLDEWSDCAICGASEGGRESEGRGEGNWLIRIVGLVQGSSSPFDGQYLKEYDPTRSGVDADGGYMLVHVAATDDPDEALRFADAVAARREWMRWDGNMRPDGKPSRPLTAFSIETARRK